MARRRRDSGQADVPPLDPDFFDSSEPEVEPSGPDESERTAALLDGWERRGEDEWANRRDFRVPGGVVPQGVVRSCAEAYALEVRRIA